ncbi:MAG: hypothetical protein PHD39_09170 [Methylobacter tundripaludum]|nr:hypothetical protein [Methylobacter tundripaludum]
MSEELNLFLGNANLEALARAHNKLVKSLTGKIKTLESRLYALETQKDHMAHMFDLQNDWDISSRLISERHSSRLSALENIIACDGIDARLHQPSVEKPAETEREWITPGSYVWVRRLRDGEIFNVRLSEVVLQPDKFTHIMPYHPGDKKPEPPKGER